MTAALEVRGLSVIYKQGKRSFTALREIDLEIAPNQTVGIVGESGCGKSTLAKTLIGFVEPEKGQVLLDGVDLSRMNRRDRRPYRRRMQMIFQDPQASLNPRQTIGRALETPLAVHGLGDTAQRRTRIAELLSLVGLPEAYISRYPHELSGGQRQRVGIARALAVSPMLLIADEAVSALDVSIQGQILNLLMDIKQHFGLSLLFISHDLAAVQHVSDRIIVMYLGRIVEIGDRSSMWRKPLHPYTQMLMRASPSADPALARQQRLSYASAGELPSVLDPPSGCAFHPRCPYATDICRQVEPELKQYEAGRLSACHHASLEAPTPDAHHD